MIYKIKHMKGKADNLQEQISNWINESEHIVIKSMNIWAEKDMSYATIIYKTKQFY